MIQRREHTRHGDKKKVPKSGAGALSTLGADVKGAGLDGKQMASSNG